MIRWEKTCWATARTSLVEGAGRPDSMALAFAPRIRFWEARGPAPHSTYFFTTGIASDSRGRDALARDTAYEITCGDTGTVRTRRCIASTSLRVTTGFTVTSRSAVVS